MGGNEPVAAAASSSSSSSSSSSDPLTLVLLPSLGDVKEEYRKLVDEAAVLHAFQRIVVCDLRGMGESDTSFSSYTPLDTGKDVVSLLESLQLNNVVLCGNSMCAASVLYATMQVPGRVAGTVLLSPFAWDHDMPPGVSTLLHLLLNTCTGPGFWTTYYRSLYVAPGAVGDFDAYVAALHKNLCEPGRMGALRGHVFGSKAPCVPDFAALCDRPLAVIFGNKDPDFPSIEAEVSLFEKKLPQTAGKVVVLADVGHYPMVRM